MWKERGRPLSAAAARVESSADALDCLRGIGSFANVQPPDVVLLDLDLANGDAWDLLESGSAHQSVRHLLERDLLERLGDDLHGPGLPLGEERLEPPVPDPDKIVCIGLNYRSHAAEAGLEPPGAPTFIAKFRNCLAPAGSAVTLPASSEKVDF